MSSAPDVFRACRRGAERIQENNSMMMTMVLVKKTVAAGALVAALAVSGGTSRALAQESGDSSKSTTLESSKPVEAYRLDFSVNELEDGKKINTRQYSMNLNANDANEIKIGTRVPVDSGHEQFQYLDVGTSIWCRIGERSEGIPMAVRADISTFAIPDHATHD